MPTWLTRWERDGRVGDLAGLNSASPARYSGTLEDVLPRLVEISNMKLAPLLAATAMLAITFQSARAADAVMLKAGDKAPAFTLKGSDGKTYKLSQFQGKKAVVVAWFPKAFTGG